MIPEFDLEKLMAYSERDENNNMQLDIKIAPDEIIDLAKTYHWKPFDKVDGVEYQL